MDGQEYQRISDSLDKIAELTNENTTNIKLLIKTSEMHEKMIDKLAVVVEKTSENWARADERIKDNCGDINAIGAKYRHLESKINTTDKKAEKTKVQLKTIFITLTILIAIAGSVSTYFLIT